MKKLVLILLTSLLLVEISIFCSEADSKNIRTESLPQEQVTNNYTYWALGTGFPLWISGKIGYRSQCHHHGFDCGVSITPLYIGNSKNDFRHIIESHIFMNVLYYKNPNTNKQGYIGLGANVGMLIIDMQPVLYLSPRFILGKEFKTLKNSRQFIQLDIGQWLYPHKFIPVSTINFTWGLAF